LRTVLRAVLARQCARGRSARVPFRSGAAFAVFSVTASPIPIWNKAIMAEISKHFTFQKASLRETILSRLAAHLIYFGLAATVVWTGMLVYAVTRMF
jgi:hypothetical protein